MNTELRDKEEVSAAADPECDRIDESPCPHPYSAGPADLCLSYLVLGALAYGVWMLLTGMHGCQALPA